MIPHKIFQTWKTKYPTDKKAEYLQSIKDKNKDFDHFLFDDNDCDMFIQQNYPQYHSYYKQLKMPVQKADLWRYLVVYHNGGWYIDIDCIGTKSFGDLKIPKQDGDLIVVEREFPRPLSIGGSYVRNPQYAQFWFGATQKHPALLEAVENIIENMDKNHNTDHNTNCDSTDHHIDHNTDQYTLNLTGPGPFSDAVQNHLDSSYVIYNNLADIFSLQIGLLKQWKNTPVVHKCEGSWKKDNNNQWISIVLIVLIIVIVLIIIAVLYKVKYKKR